MDLDRAKETVDAIVCVKKTWFSVPLGLDLTGQHLEFFLDNKNPCARGLVKLPRAVCTEGSVVVGLNETEIVCERQVAKKAMRLLGHRLSEQQTCFACTENGVFVLFERTEPGEVRLAKMTMLPEKCNEVKKCVERLKRVARIHEKLRHLESAEESLRETVRQLQRKVAAYQEELQNIQEEKNTLENDQ